MNELARSLVAAMGGEAEVARHFVRYALLVARVAPLFLVAPWLALRSQPTVLRLGAALALSLGLYGLVAGAEVPLDVLGVVLALLRETLTGALFAFATALPFLALEGAGVLVDTWRGAANAESTTPGGDSTTPLGNLYSLFGVALFVALSGHVTALAAFGDTLRLSPIGGAMESAGIGEIGLSAMRLTGDALALSLALAAPAGMAIVLVEAGLAILGRASPQIPLHFAGMPLRAVAGLCALLFAATFLPERLGPALEASIAVAATWVRAIR